MGFKLKMEGEFMEAVEALALVSGIIMTDGIIGLKRAHSVDISGFIQFIIL